MDARIRVRPMVESPGPCKMNILGSNPLAYQVRVHKNCVHNQYKALAERHITDRGYIGFKPDVWMLAQRKQFRKLSERMEGMTFNLLQREQIPIRYAGGKRLVYERAVEELKGGLRKQHYYVKMFVKPDKHPLCEVYTKKPRAIQYRSPCFNIEMATRLVSLEENVYSVKIHGRRIFAKGRNLQQRAQDILDIWNSFESPVVIETDHAKFDSCVKVEHLKSCHRFYLKYYPSKRFYSLLCKQLKNRGFSNNLKYRVTGTRMSGDFDTALGNSLINFVVLNDWLDRCGVQGHAYIDGDDSLVFLEAKEVHKLDFGMFSDYGFETESKIVKDIIEAEFCKGKVVRSDPPILVRNPYRLLSHFNVCLKDFGPKSWPGLLAGKAVCEYYANQGVPYLQAFFAKFLSERFQIPIEDRYRYSIVKTHQMGRVTTQAYADLYTAWDFGVAESCLLMTLDSYGRIRNCGGPLHLASKKKFKNVLADESLYKAWAGFLTLDASRDLCSGAGCACIYAARGGSCNERIFRWPTAPSATAAGTGSGAPTASR